MEAETSERRLASPEPETAPFRQDAAGTSDDDEESQRAAGLEEEVHWAESEKRDDQKELPAEGHGSETVLGADDVTTPEETGELVLQIRSRDAYAEWLVFEKTLRELLKDLRVKGIEIRPESSCVRVLGASVTGLMQLNGTRLPDGRQVQVTNLRGQRDSFLLVFLKTEDRPIESKQ
jgi:hypothetical protein